MNAIISSPSEQWIIDCAREITARGQEMGLPLIATCADISSARPATIYGRPIASLFEFAKDAREYWLQTDLALQNAIVSVVRCTAEPFYYDHGVIDSWQPLQISPKLIAQTKASRLSICCAIVTPIHLPGGVIGALVWATDEPLVQVRPLFEQHAERLHVLALRFLCACNASMHGKPMIGSYGLTRREIQCLKLAAAGKTDEEIGMILSVATPTVRFHLKRAGERLGQSGRLRTVHRAAALGFISMHL